MKSRVAKNLVCLLPFVLLFTACSGGRSHIRMSQRDLSVRTNMSEQDGSLSSTDEAALDEAKAELEIARKQLAELQATKASAAADPQALEKLQNEVIKANERVAEAQSELTKKDKESKAAMEKQRRDLLGFAMQYKHSLKCLEIEAGASVDGARFRQMTCNQNNIQRFRLVEKTSGSWIQNVATGKCISTLAASNDNLTAIVQSTCVENGSMLFSLQSDGNGYFAIRNLGSNRCVDIEAISMVDGAGAQIYDCLNGDGQKVKIIQAVP